MLVKILPMALVDAQFPVQQFPNFVAGVGKRFFSTCFNGGSDARNCD